MRFLTIAQATGIATTAKRLLLRLDDPQAVVVRIWRLRYNDDGRLLAYEEISMPSTRLPHDSDLSLDLIDLARQRGLTLGRATEFVLRAPADPGVATHLGVAVGTKVVKLDRIVETPDGVPIEWRLTYFRE
jgi:DNA-binding GntR family transcriptional regulator